MSEDEKPPPITRAKRAKGDSSVSGTLFDGGAIAIGLLLPLSTFAPTVVWELPPSITLGLIASGLFIGGYLTGFLTATTNRCQLCQGTVMAFCFCIIVVFVSATTLLSGDSISDLSIIVALGDQWEILAIGTAVAVLIATVGSALAGRGNTTVT